MMKMLLKICGIIWVAGIFAHTALSASVTPAAATNYCFFTPTHPASIRGEVIGDPPAYLTPRSEDVDWLMEAAIERQSLVLGRLSGPHTALRPEFGKWNLSETNRFARWVTAVDAVGVTNVVVGYNIVTNSQPEGASYLTTYDAYSILAGTLALSPGVPADRSYGRFLDPDATLLGVARAAHDWGDPPPVTNVTFYSYSTNAYTNAYSTIEMPMTDGTVSVHTNSWRALILFPVTIASTNVSNAIPLDYCHDSVGLCPFPNYTNFFLNVNSPPARGPGSFAAAYRGLRGAVRLADQGQITNSPPRTVSTTTSCYGYSSGEDITTTVRTNSYSVATYEFSGHLLEYWSHAWDESPDDDKMSDDLRVDEDVPSAFTAIAPTRFESALVTTGGAMRVEVEAAYAVVHFTYQMWHQVFRDTYAWILPHDDRVRNYDNINEVTIDKLVVVPLSNPSLVLSQPDAQARVTIDKRALCVAAAAACGAPSPPQSAETYVPPSRETHEWTAECSSIVLLYRLHPASKFTDW